MPVWSWVLCAVLLGLVALYGITALRFRIAFAPTEVLPVVTSDGHTLRLYRHRHETGGPGTPSKGAVLCLHGLGASHFNFDFPGTANIAGYLAKAGYDVYVASYRGDTDSARPAGKKRAQWNFDDYVRLDLPALLDAVMAKSAVRKVHLLGHSMGGLVAYALAAVHGQGKLASIIAMGSPVGFHEKTKVIRELLWLEPLLLRLPSLQVRILARMAAPFVALIGTARFMRQQYNPQNVDAAYVAVGCWHALSNISRGLLLQFVDWIRNDRFGSMDGAVDYRDGLRKLDIPLMVVAGAADFMCRIPNAMRAYELARSSFKRAVILGREDGCGLDYGHIDMIFGRKAEVEVFPRVLGFLTDVDALTA